MVADVVGIQTQLAFPPSAWMKPTTLWAQNTRKITPWWTFARQTAEEMKLGFSAELFIVQEFHLDTLLFIELKLTFLCLIYPVHHSSRRLFIDGIIKWSCQHCSDWQLAIFELTYPNKWTLLLLNILLIITCFEILIWCKNAILAFVLLIGRVFCCNWSCHLFVNDSQLS